MSQGIEEKSEFMRCEFAKKIGNPIGVFLCILVANASAQLQGTFLAAAVDTNSIDYRSAWLAAGDAVNDNLWGNSSAAWMRGGKCYKAGTSEQAPEIITTIGDLVAGAEYRIRIVYLYSTSSWGIKAKLGGQSYAVYNSSNGSLTGDYSIEYSAVLGTAYADYFGDINVNIIGQTGLMTYYIGVSYEQTGNQMPEVNPANPGNTPLIRQLDWASEAELFDYLPRYKPSTISFDNDNVPYIFTAAFNSHDPYRSVIMTIDGLTGKWIELDWKAVVKNAYPTWDGKFRNDRGCEKHITFDKDGDAYFVVDADSARSNLGKSLLMHSKDKCRTWQIYNFGNYNGLLIEHNDGNNKMDGPPPILIHYDGWTYNLDLLVPRKESNGTLSFTGPFRVTNDSLILMNYSNSLVTSGSKTHIVWHAKTGNGLRGTPMYVTTFDKITSTFAPRVWVGNSNCIVAGDAGINYTNSHDWPAIALDSNQYLHVVIGAHHIDFKYTKSLNPNDSTSWTEPVTIGTNGQSYVGLLIDKKDTIHVTARDSSQGYRFNIIYYKKVAGQSWQPYQNLVKVLKDGYAHWYQDMSIDRKDNLFLRYTYFGDQLTVQQANDYMAKYPRSNLIRDTAAGCEDPTRKCWYDGGTTGSTGFKENDPALIYSSNGGNSWRLMLTSDVIPAYPMTDLNKDFDCDIEDMGIFAENWLNSNCGNIADFDGSCEVDLMDYAGISRDWLSY